ncbi:hypothetical protein E8E13_008000 [Curvularia kusanoi]|uniref:Uncharacterized protein n=1 Tax=Curvularia kusanoi TaxID=90978 RepID=A0A9P4WC69_CURKU|nr:hypothetical protein E8E13_008000 [Curvularia kusanoi]
MTSAWFEEDTRVSETLAYDFVNSPCIRVDVGTDTEMKSFTGSILPVISDSSARERDTEEGIEKYQQEEFDGEYGHENEDIITVNQAQDQFLALSKLYVLAEQLLDGTTKNAAFAALAAHAKDADFTILPNEASVYVIYEGKTDGNKARQWLIDLYVDHGGTRAFGSSELGYQSEFIADVADGLLATRIKPGFHEHLRDQLKFAEGMLQKDADDLAGAKDSIRTRDYQIEQLQKEVKKLRRST